MAKTLTLKDTAFYRSAPNVEAIPCSLLESCSSVVLTQGSRL